MEIEGDQSIKIEQTHRATALAFSDGEARAILIPARVKQAAIRKLRGLGFTGSRATLWLFAACLHLLLCDRLTGIDRIIVDDEYPGRAADVRLMLLNLLRRELPGYPAHRIVFQRIGKKSRAHTLAFNVAKGVCEADRIMRLDEFARLWRQK